MLATSVLSGGRRPERALAAYGSYTRALPYSNEQGLRMVIGAAVREAAARGIILRPVFSLFSYHGPVFRVMLRSERGGVWPHEHYNFIGHCFQHDRPSVVPWRDVNNAHCRCGGAGSLFFIACLSLCLFFNLFHFVRKQWRRANPGGSRHMVVGDRIARTATAEGFAMGSLIYRHNEF